MNELLTLMKNWLESHCSAGFTTKESEQIEKDFEAELIHFIKLHSSKQEEKDGGK